MSRQLGLYTVTIALSGISDSDRQVSVVLLQSELSERRHLVEPHVHYNESANRLEIEVGIYDVSRDGAATQFVEELHEIVYATFAELDGIKMELLQVQDG